MDDGQIPVSDLPDLCVFDMNGVDPAEHCTHAKGLASQHECPYWNKGEVAQG
jgi:hypothetical protein